MKPEEALKYIKNAMNLRTPQEKSLHLFANYLQAPAGQKLLSRLKKETRGNLPEILQESKKYFNAIPEAQEFSEFERGFPAYTFALATGVGKTRLMGAFVAYLFLVYNIQHFLIVAPNLTIFRKLFDDFSKVNNPKYVFKGIQEITIFNTAVITSENYHFEGDKEVLKNNIEINIFNVQQFAQKDLTSERGIKKAWETANNSYFDYLKDQNDLVVMLDEAHHYHANAALVTLDSLNPLFGLEMTATPYLGQKGSGKNMKLIKMKNVLYAYNLGDAIRGKLVKDPWVGTEADIDFSKFDIDSIETDARKLQLAVFFHERAKHALKEYAMTHNKPLVKPVLLVVAKNTAHATELCALINSDDFRGGEFKGKVIEIHTNLRGEDADKSIEFLISLEQPSNIIEIVIHVNMLKEGWDVTNVYTIAPLRESAAAILTEQTIGRGLRLPYGERTGVPLVDRLIIVAHEQYSKVVALAKDSRVIQGQVEQISSQQIKEAKTFTTVQPIFIEDVKYDITHNEKIMLEVNEKAEEDFYNQPNKENMDEKIKEVFIDNKKEEIVMALAKETTKNLTYSNNTETQFNAPLIYGPDTLFGSFSDDVKKEVVKIREHAAQKMEKRNIPIPLLKLTPHFEDLLIEDFDLDTSGLRNYTNERSILEAQLQNNIENEDNDENVPGRKKSEITTINSFGSHTRQSPQSTIIASLVDCPLVDYDDPKQKPLLLKLADQAVIHYKKSALNDDNLALIIESNVRTIAEDIYKQFLIYKKYIGESFLEPSIGAPKPYPLEYSASFFVAESTYTLGSQVNTFSSRLTYGSFQKACHSKYRFDSSDEVRFAFLLEQDDSVLNWLRPAPNQFDGLYWRDEAGDSSHLYEPDFVVDLKDEIVLVEVKPESEINDAKVQAKKQTAEEYCKVVTKNLGKYDIKKPWKYVIVPTNRITIQSTVAGLLG